MREKLSAQPTESCRWMRGNGKAAVFRSGAANDESDGFARYSELKMALQKLSSTQEKAFRLIWVVPREREARPKGRLLYFFAHTKGGSYAQNLQF